VNNSNIYGISQNPDTKDYIMVFPSKYYCEKCGEKYTNVKNKWCKPCFINGIKNNTSGIEIIDNLIQEIQLKIDASCEKIFEWIPYNQFINIIESEKRDFDILYSAIWRDGPLNYNNRYYRKQNEIVTLRCFDNSHNITNEFLNEV
jgi:hypothetical protein